MKTKKSKEKKEYTTMVRLSREHFEMLGILRSKYSINTSSLFRNTVEKMFKKLEGDMCG